MKKLLYLFTIILFIGCSSNDDNSNASSSFVGTYDCQFSAGGQNGLPCTLKVNKTNGNYTIIISGPMIEPDIQLQGTEGGSQIDIVPCTNYCYQGDGNVASGGTLKRSNGKIRLNFGVYFQGDESDAYWTLVEEL